MSAKCIICVITVNMIVYNQMHNICLICMCEWVYICIIYSVYMQKNMFIMYVWVSIYIRTHKYNMTGMLLPCKSYLSKNQQLWIAIYMYWSGTSYKYV